ncbi:hypothetical protein [Streptomyces sp. NBC_01353]|uniref:hypothetical protein n=1 Tax=Streptomyces sp. NBC_01353 TaxID=2903835 RepID=UPI002E37983A|nr:hypothetical protein [Streptomyces sp. NBC_01353]
MAERLTFVLDGRDQLSSVLGHAGDSAERLRQQMTDAADGSGQALLTLTQDADGRLRDLEGRFVSTADAAALMAHQTGRAVRPTTDWADAAREGAKAGEALKKSLISLAPAAIPAAASMAPIAPAVLAGAAAAGVYMLAIGKQISALTEAAEAEQKYRDAVEESGARSEAAVKAQTAYAKAMAKLPPATREAAAALSVLKDEYKEWSDSLAADTMSPLTKGMGVLQAILPKLTPMVRNFSHELDRTVTLAAGGVASPGFDAFMARVTSFADKTMVRANDKLVHFLRVADTDGVGEGLNRFLAFAREQGPVVADVLRNISTALVNVLEAGADVGVGMLSVVSVLAKLVAAVPPGAIAALLQLAIAIKVVRLAAAGLAAGRVALAAFGTQILVMRAAAAGTTGPMAALTASFGTMSRGAKLALAGTGIGLLVIALTELSQAGRQAPPDVDRLTSSLKELAYSGKITGEAAKAFGNDLGGLYDKVRSLTDPSTTDDVQQFIVTLGGLGTWDSTPVEDAKENLDAIDQALASMVSSGNAEMASAALKRLTVEYGKGGRDTKAFTKELDAYQSALADAKFEQQLAADSMGLFGQQALQTKAKLDAQKVSADGLRQALVALNDVNRAGLGAQIAFEQAIDDGTEAAKKYKDIWVSTGGRLDVTTEKGRNAATSLNNLASKTDEAAAAARESGASWNTVNGIYERGRGKLIQVAMQMGLNRDQAKRLADQILKTPDKTARLKGNLEDLQAKLADAKRRLGSVPDSRKAQVRAEIGQLQEKIRQAKGAIASVRGKTVSVMIDYRTRNSGASDFAKSIGGYAGGGTPRAGEWAWVGEQGPELIHFQGAGARVYDSRTSMRMGAPTAGRSVGSMGTGGGGGGGLTVHLTVNGALDAVAVAQQIRQMLNGLQRNMGLPPGTVMA